MVEQVEVDCFSLGLENSLSVIQHHPNKHYMESTLLLTNHVNLESPLEIAYGCLH